MWVRDAGMLVAQSKGGGPLGAWCANSSDIMSSKGLILWWHALAERIWCSRQPHNLVACVPLTCLWMWSKWDWKWQRRIESEDEWMTAAHSAGSIFSDKLQSSSHFILPGQAMQGNAFSQGCKYYCMSCLSFFIRSEPLVLNTRCQKRGSWEPVSSADTVRSWGCDAVCQIAKHSSLEPLHFHQSHPP